MCRHGAGEVVIEVAHGGACRKQSLERYAVPIKRNVEHRDDRVAGSRRTEFNLRQQIDVAFQSGHELRRGFGGQRFGQPQLMQRAHAVRIAVENIDTVFEHRAQTCRPI